MLSSLLMLKMLTQMNKNIYIFIFFMPIDGKFIKSLLQILNKKRRDENKIPSSHLAFPTTQNVSNCALE